MVERILDIADLKEMIINKFKCSDFEILEWTFKKDEQSSGFYGFPSREYIAFKLNNGKIIGLHMFVRRSPIDKSYHGELMVKLKVFSKEDILYNGLLRNLKQYMNGKVYPDCYLTRKNKLIVLEDINVLGYKSIGMDNIFNLEQMESTLKTLSDLHAGSIIFEEQNGSRLDELYEEALFETHFVSDINHPWFHNGCTSMNAIEAVVEAYFPHIPPEIYEKAYDDIRTLPYRVIPSRKYRNVLIHGCITCSNVLFKSNEDEGIESCVITGFQHARYNTPALDVLLAIHLTTNSKLRSENFEALLVYYYTHFSKQLTQHGIDAKKILTWDQFKTSIQDTMQTAQAMAIIYLHLLLLPKERMTQVLKSNNGFKEFIENDRNEIILEEMRNNNAYRKRIVQAMQDLFDTVKSNKKRIYN